MFKMNLVLAGAAGVWILWLIRVDNIKNKKVLKLDIKGDF